VPGVLFDLLRQVLGHPGLTALKGIALEVDTKAVPVIVEEFGHLREEPACRQALERAGVPPPSERERVKPSLMVDGSEERLTKGYQSYARVVSGQEDVERTALASLAEGVDPEGLHRYATRYLPYELVCWGGDLAELFPAIWKSLEKRGITATDFVRFWFRQSRPVADPYDFFYLKLERWVEFVGEVAPDLLEQAQREAGILRALHAELNDEAIVLESPA
jgi:hypothetical protein